LPYAELEGVSLYYERAGSGDPELLFVHGWCCDHTAFGPQFAHFAQAHTVTALDLRGSGRSSAAEGYQIADFTNDLARFCSAVGIVTPVVVGHSLGGMIAVELAAQHPSLLRGLVLVDPGPIDPLPETLERFRSVAHKLAAPDGEDFRRAFVHDMGARDEGLANWIGELMCGAPLPVATDVMRGVVAWNGVAAFAQCAVPTLLLRPDLYDDMEDFRMRSVKPDMEVGITVGAGHFHQLEVPDQVNGMIERFLATRL
jgi:pimeloyl-ACP methyl ester carboxylesterase